MRKLCTCVRVWGTYLCVCVPEQTSHQNRAPQKEIFVDQMERLEDHFYVVESRARATVCVVQCFATGDAYALCVCSRFADDRLPGVKWLRVDFNGKPFIFRCRVCVCVCAFIHDFFFSLSLFYLQILRIQMKLHVVECTIRHPFMRIMAIYIYK